jgi:hypothetical protein
MTDTENFDGAREPMRALRDLISACETVFGPDRHEQGILERAQDGLSALRKLFGDTRPAEEIAFAQMVEPPSFDPDHHPGCKKVRDAVIALMKLPMDADCQIDDGEELRDFTVDHVTDDDPGEPQLVVIRPAVAS